MAGVFGVTPMQPYPSWAQGLEQGTGAIANAMYQRRMLDLERQKFGLQQAEAGYQPPTTAQVYQPGKLQAPSMVASENVPTTTPGVTGMGQGPAGAPDAMARTQGSYQTVKQPGYYDLTKSLAYQTSLARVMEMQQRGVEAAKISAAAREHVADEADQTRLGISNNLNGYIGPDGQFHAGVRVLGNEQQSDYMYGPDGTRTQSALAVQAPRLATQQAIADQSNVTRQGNLSERQRHDLATEGIGQQGVAIRATNANQRTGQLGNLTPAEAHAWQSAYGNASYLGLPPDSAEARANTAVAALRRTTGPTTRPAAVSGPAIAPTVPRSGAEASGLRPNAIHGNNAPTTPLGNRGVSDASTGTYTKATNLPKSPSDATGAAPVTRRPLSADEKAAAAKDAGFAQFLTSKGYTPKDWQQ